MSCCHSEYASSYNIKLGKGIIGIAKSVLHIDLAPEVLIRKRLDICRDCDNATKNSDSRFDRNKGLTNFSRCRICKCFITAKTKLFGESCPDAKW